MSSMSDSTTKTTEPSERRPVRLGRDHSTSMNAMIRRVMPDVVEDGGVSPLDVCAFNSSI